MLLPLASSVESRHSEADAAPAETIVPDCSQMAG
jgi:hypothetical protein